jgi:hypothetical protein
MNEIEISKIKNSFEDTRIKYDTHAVSEIKETDKIN